MLEEVGAASLKAADVITDYNNAEDDLTFNNLITNKKLWYEKGVDAYGNDGANDTVIYGANADGSVNKSDIIVILADYNADISENDFSFTDASTISTIEML